MAVLWWPSSPKESEPTTRPNHSPPPHEVNVWGQEGEGLAISRDAWLHAATRGPTPPPPVRKAAGPAVGVGSGFKMVGSVAVLEGDELTATPSGSGFGLDKDDLAEVSRRFIAAFGDNYDQIAVFLGFTDRLSQQSLAYQQPVKNNIRGLGLGLFDETAKFGSLSGRMESMLNMKRINLYGRDAANDPQNDLYSVWAQEAGHRWAIYFKYRFAGETTDRSDLLLRQNAHWAPWVQSDGSFLDGLTWQDNKDGTFSVVDFNKRYGAMDQYAMGLRQPNEVPAFFLLDDFKDEAGAAIARNSRFNRGVKYKARRIDVTVEDVIRAMGARDPATSPAAEDLRMGVVFLTPPGQGLAPLMGEAFRVESTRAPWDGFYNASAGGRGKVCTALLHPCRGPAFAFGKPSLSAAGRVPGVAGPGDALTISVPVTNVGTEAAVANVNVGGANPFVFAATTVATPPLEPGATGSVVLQTQVPQSVACGVDFKLDFQAPGRLGPSLGSQPLQVGLQPGPGSTLEAADTPALWQINPDGTDTAVLGMWQWGTPEPTKAFDFVLQPAGAVSGTKAFVTGAAAGDSPGANDVDFDVLQPTVGRTTLQSPNFALAGLTNPRLTYQLHFVAAGFEKEVLVPGNQDAFFVQASLDGGPWVEVDRVPATLFLGWEQRVVPLSATLQAALATAAQIRFRFVAQDSDLSETVVEAAIDDVFLLGELPGCGTLVAAPDAGVDGGVVSPSDNGCSCRLGQRRHTSSGAWLSALFAACAYAVRRKPRSSASRGFAEPSMRLHRAFAKFIKRCS
ncbi:MAG: hypothetical protein SF187_07620 [Deltaproteobacteria bacterium]|nr:hypothetical protein [Deltaproteobacteria bacterium]